MRRLTKEQKARIAAGKIAGRSDPAIAREAGVSLSSVSHAGADPDVRSMMRRFADGAEAALSRLYMRMLSSLEEDLASATDWSARQQLRAEIARIIALADGAVRDGGATASPGAGGFTLLEALKAYRDLREAE